MSLRVLSSRPKVEESFDIDLSDYHKKIYEDPLFEKSNKEAMLNDIMFRGDFNFENYRTDEGELVLKFTDNFSKHSIFLYFDNLSEVVKFSKKIQSNVEFTTYGHNQFDVMSLFKNHFLYKRIISENVFVRKIQDKINHLKNSLK